MESYFAAYDLANLSDEDIYLHLQRLSFSKVRQGLFRLYGEMDPPLGKILHNVKVAARALDLFVEIDRLGETCLVPVMCDAAKHLPPIETQKLVDWLSEIATGNEFIPELLGKLSRFLRNQETCRRAVPIVTIALAIRTFYEQKRTPQLAEPSVSIDEERMTCPP